MNTGAAHIIILVVTLLTLATTISLLIVALNIQKEIKEKLDKAEEAANMLKKYVSTPVSKIGPKISKWINSL